MMLCNGRSLTGVTQHKTLETKTKEL